ncbi:TonB family protein [Flavihumibacter stibioxidans]|uniref:TonB C-terminal domain-containing protein n=1 Tax=Flavihumibacter stibioxidans TaxID=1834163 RepID=A0ABR7MDR7_9BACT|nr:energy transducer TonB [Flavihumibacter stibioxidans]MBC6492959.1 hypothetical protein [Flavihumibacter stibioxidans]
MRFLSVLIALTTLSLTLAAQKRYAGKKAQLSYLKSDGSPASEKEAQLMVAITKVNDTAWRKDQYQSNGPIQTSQYFKTKELDLAHGPTVVYRPHGLAESFGTYLEGKQHGDWYFVNDTGRIYLQKRFDQGKLLETIDLLNKPEEKKPKEEGVESSFEGGIRGWTSYLQENLRYPKKAIQNDIQGRVSVFFSVEKDGTVSDLFLFRSVEYSLDQETARLIEAGPKWIPATLNREPVRSFKLQPVTYRFQ